MWKSCTRRTYERGRASQGGGANSSNAGREGQGCEESPSRWLTQVKEGIPDVLSSDISGRKWSQEDGGLGEPRHLSSALKPEQLILTQALGLLLCCRDLGGDLAGSAGHTAHSNHASANPVIQAGSPGIPSRPSFHLLSSQTVRPFSRFYLPMWCPPHPGHQPLALIFLIKKRFIFVCSHRDIVTGPVFFESEMFLKVSCAELLVSSCRCCSGKLWNL